PGDERAEEDQAVQPRDQQRAPHATTLERHQQQSDREGPEPPDGRRREGEVHEHGSDRGEPYGDPQGHERAHRSIAYFSRHSHTPAYATIPRRTPSSARRAVRASSSSSATIES